ncbi:hypothetical protein [Streptococcus sobrinus]|uniref:Uncharacterized protein n=1 Tax=Streptococcus sobrinus W1703 TaxID=1227275 RepID=U2IS13_9STRE|nr:hypothetical protein [Streptococcus sobrinus]AWN61065.1 hypothetical protein DLJ52_02105 [Streptococcus sobrinus]AWN62938.1 hypothetical protein DLJ51_02105 [Streptococcus sobrinus]ERJ76716.1 hypothetical protein HMPREF1557_00794 [Streptococcus sobrinus W1703]
MSKFFKDNFLIFLIAILALITILSPSKQIGKFMFIVLLLTVLSMAIIYLIKLFQFFRNK